MRELTDKQKLIIQGKICPYCGSNAEFTNSSVVYGKSYGMIYLCRSCNAYVGVHKGTDRALGRLANKQLRALKHEAHEYFDKIWQLQIMKRAEAYSWLSSVLGLPKEYTHIGMFSEKTCKQVIYFSKQLLNNYRRLDLDFGTKPKTPYYEND